MYDVIVIGGSYAGLAAAMQLGRARRRVLVVDAGLRRNRFAKTSHGFLGHDGAPPEQIAERGKAEVLAYPTVSWRDGVASGARRDGNGFAVRVGDEEHLARRLVLATGTKDGLPPIPGLSALWGRAVFHCPYCHGYELDRGALGVLGTGPLSLHAVVLVSEWAAPGKTTLFLDGSFTPDAHELAAVEARGIHVTSDLVTSAEPGPGGHGIRLLVESGGTHDLAGVFVVPRTEVLRAFAEDLGCALTDGPTGAFYQTDPTKETTVPGVFACGDVALPFGSVALAVADGVLAGTAAHRSLVFRS